MDRGRNDEPSPSFVNRFLISSSVKLQAAFDTVPIRRIPMNAEQERFPLQVIKKKPPGLTSFAAWIGYSSAGVRFVGGTGSDERAIAS